MAEWAYPLTDRDSGAIVYRTTIAEITTSQFIAAAQRLSEHLLPGGPIANLCQDRVNFAVTFAACLLAGRPCLLTSDRRPSRLRQLAATMPGTVAVSDAEISAEDILPTLRFESDFSEAEQPCVPMICADATAAIVLTSGSTGEPRAHIKSWGQLVARSRAAIWRFSLVGHQIHLLPSIPPQHMYGFETSILLPLFGPITTYCWPAFYKTDVIAALDAMPAPRLLISTPIHLRALQNADLLALDIVISATAELPIEIAAHLEQNRRAIALEIYGATEFGSVASRRTIYDIEWAVYPSVMLEKTERAFLFSGPHAKARTIDDDILINSAGKFRFIGRKLDTIKIGGKRASLNGLNKILMSIDGVEEGLFVVRGEKDRGLTQRIVAYVVAPSLSDHYLLSALRDLVDVNFLPRRIIRVNSLPRNDVGKISRADLEKIEAHRKEG